MRTVAIRVALAVVFSGVVLALGCNGHLAAAGDDSAQPPATSTAGQGDASEGATGPSGADAGPIEPPPPSSCAASGGAIAALTKRTNIGAPMGNATGIAYDGVALWILSGGHNASAHRLVRFSPDTRAIDRDFSFSNLIEQLGTGAYGFTWDGHSVWISVSGNTNKLMKVDPSTGTITETFSSPANLGPSELEFDGTSLWLSTGTGTAFVLDPVTGGITRQFPLVAGGTSRDNGIALRRGEVWSGQLFGGLDIYDAATGTPKGHAVHADCTAFTQDEVGPSTFIGEELVMLSSLGITYYGVSATTP